MIIDFAVRRTRMSATQGEATVYMNGHFVANFADDIQLVEPGGTYYGDNIGGWASAIPDRTFIEGFLWHPYDARYEYRKALRDALDAIEQEEKNHG